MIVQKSDFITWVDLGNNIPNDKVTRCVTNAEVECLRPKLGDDLVAAMRVISDTNPALWVNTTAYTTSQHVLRYDDDEIKLYTALGATTGDDPLTSPSDWELNALGTFWAKYVKPWAVFEAFRKFLLWQGKNVTQYGIRVMFEDTSTQIDGQTLGYLLKDIESSCNVYRNKALRYLDEVEWTIDGTLYEIDCDNYKTNHNTFGIRAIGKGKSLKNGI